MGAKYDHDSWIYDFSLVLTQSAMRSFRRDPEFDVFAGSKARAALWLAIVAAASGAFGGMLVSGALWRSMLQLPLWLVAFIVLCIVVRRATLALSGAYLASLAGWCNGWGLLIGACAMWGAQLSSPGWTYGIAGGVGFLIGITQGVYEAEDLEGHDSFFALGMVMAPVRPVLPPGCIEISSKNPRRLAPPHSRVRSPGWSSLARSWRCCSRA